MDRSNCPSSVGDPLARVVDRIVAVSVHRTDAIGEGDPWCFRGARASAGHFDGAAYTAARMGQFRDCSARYRLHRDRHGSQCPQMRPWWAWLEALFYFYAVGGLISYRFADRRATTDELFAARATFTLLA